jgi:DNA primase
VAVSDPIWTRDEYLSHRGITPEWADYFELRIENGWIMIPYRSATGLTVSYRFRRIGEGQPKYISKKGSKAHLFNVVDSCRPHVYITEGEFDCIILKQLGLDAVGVAGVLNFMEPWVWLFQGVDVTIAYDGDEAGKKEGLSLARRLMRHAENVNILKVPDGHDITSLYLDGRLKDVLAA